MAFSVSSGSAFCRRTYIENLGLGETRRTKGNFGNLTYKQEPTPAVRCVSHPSTEGVPDGPTGGRTYGLTDKLSYRDSRTHLTGLKNFFGIDAVLRRRSCMILVFFTLNRCWRIYIAEVQ